MNCVVDDPDMLIADSGGNDAAIILPDVDVESVAAKVSHFQDLSKVELR